MENTVRINKALAQAGVCSRRHADSLIADGLVSVNGIIASAGQGINPDKDLVLVNNKKVQLVSANNKIKHNYILLNKPIEIVSTAYDPEGRETVLDILPQSFLYDAKGQKHRLYPVGRLDYFSEGLILLTDDGELTHRLTHPSFSLPREYLVVVRGKLTDAMQKTMQSGMTLKEGDKLAPMQVNLVDPISSKYSDYFSHLQTKENTFFTMTLIQGLNRQIRRVCRDLDLTILKLCRTAHGAIELGNLPLGSARYLTQVEIKSLYDSVGLTASNAASSSKPHKKS